MPRVLVTGASGFLGSATLAPLRARRFEVHAVARAPGSKHDGVTWHAADLLAPGAATRLIEEIRPTHVLHLAWHLPVGSYREPTGHAPWIGATSELARAFGRHGGQRFVGVGSCAEYSPHDAPIHEHAATDAADAYGRAKDAARRALQSYADDLGFAWSWARPFGLHGPRERPTRLVPSIVRAIREGRPALCSAGTQLRDPLHAEDAGDALAALVHSEVTGPINIASGEGVEVREIARRVALYAGGADLLRLGAIATPPTEPARVVADVMRLRTELGWKPSMDLDEGLRASVAWWKERPLEGTS